MRDISEGNMRKNSVLKLGLATVLGTSMLVGCASGNTSAPASTEANSQESKTESAAGASESGAAEKVSATITVWTPQEDQSVDSGNWLDVQLEAFKAAHPEWDITFVTGVCSEGDAKTLVAADPTAAADVYMYANDQIPDLLKSNAIAELGGKNRGRYQGGEQRNNRKYRDLSGWRIRRAVYRKYLVYVL